jgi:hypothetical protein
MSLDAIAILEAHAAERRGLQRILPRFTRCREKDLHSSELGFKDDPQPEFRFRVTDPALTCNRFLHRKKGRSLRADSDEAIAFS